MTALFTADIHLSANARDAYRFDWVEKRLPKLIERHNVKTLIIGGDITEEKHGHSAYLVNRIAAWAKAMTTHVEEVIIYKGNHDYVEEDDPFFMFLGLVPRVRFISRPLELQVPSLGRCLFLPHTRDHKREWAGLFERRHRYIFAHNSFAGAEMGSGRKASGIPTTDLPTDCSVCAGDIHIPQDHDQVRYVGAPYTIDFGDSYDGRVLLLDDKQRSVSSAGPQKVLVDLGLKDDIYALDAVETVKGDVVKVRVAIKQYEKAEWSVVVAGVRSWAALRSVNLHAVVPLAVNARVNRILPSGRKRRDDELVLEDFGKVRQIDKWTMNVGRRLMERSK